MARLEEFLDKKRDYSPLLVHLTKDAVDEHGFPSSAKEVLDKILRERRLRACNHFCLFDERLRESGDTSLQDKFKVACFTETPIDQIDLLCTEVSKRKFRPKPYGLVFTKEFIRQRGGNPVFYVASSHFDSLWRLFDDAVQRSFDLGDQRLLALVNRCDEQIDFHWEREWRVIGDLQFDLNDIFCGLCSQKDMTYFENKYSVVFIDPVWGLNRILDKLVRERREKSTEFPF